MPSRSIPFRSIPFCPFCALATQVARLAASLNVLVHWVGEETSKVAGGCVGEVSQNRIGAGTYRNFGNFRPGEIFVQLKTYENLRVRNILKKTYIYTIYGFLCGARGMSLGISSPRPIWSARPPIPESTFTCYCCCEQ